VIESNSLWSLLNRTNNNNTIKVALDTDQGHKTMKKFFTMIALVLMAVNVINAQYILDYGPGSPAWCFQQQMMMNQQIAQANAVLNQMAQQMVQQAMQNIQNMQMFNNNMAPVNINQMPVMPACDYSNSPSTPTVSSSYETCPECTNGYNTKKWYAGNGQIKSIQKRCYRCHGTGKIRVSNVNY